MHIKGHILYCQLLWSFNYLPYSGETCGEMIETGWAENNQTAGSTKEMNEGHRHDALDDFLDIGIGPNSMKCVSFNHSRFDD